jgi:hypothetical protein
MSREERRIARRHGRTAAGGGDTKASIIIGSVEVGLAERRDGASTRRVHRAKVGFPPQIRQIPAAACVGATEQDRVEKEAKTDAELEDMILQRLVIGGVFVSVRRDPILGWRPTVVTAPKHTRNAQELADKIAAELRKKFTLKE